MTVISKALALLDQFSQARPEIGLSEFCRLSGHDKATTYRYLTSLEGSGFVEKNPKTKAYRMGPVVLRLAQVREQTVPRKATVIAPLETLAEKLSETAHATVLSGDKLLGLADRATKKHSTRVVVDIADFPLHATASGIVCLSFGQASLMETALTSLDVHTGQTPASPEALQAAVEEARAVGIAITDQTHEAGVRSIAAPVFDQSGQVAGAIAIAGLVGRLTPDRDSEAAQAVIHAAFEITQSWGGQIPDDLQRLWSEKWGVDAAPELN